MNIFLILFAIIAFSVRIYQIANGCGLSTNCEPSAVGLYTMIYFLLKMIILYGLILFINNLFKKFT